MKLIRITKLNLNLIPNPSIAWSTNFALWIATGCKLLVFYKLANTFLQSKFAFYEINKNLITTASRLPLNVETRKSINFS